MSEDQGLRLGHGSPSETPGAHVSICRQAARDLRDACEQSCVNVQIVQTRRTKVGSQHDIARPAASSREKAKSVAARLHRSDRSSYGAYVIAVPAPASAPAIECLTDTSVCSNIDRKIENCPETKGSRRFMNVLLTALQGTASSSTGHCSSCC